MRMRMASERKDECEGVWCSLSHPYLVADNRHYTFYIWKDVIQGRWGPKYLLPLLYLFSAFLIFWHLGE